MIFLLSKVCVLSSLGLHIGYDIRELKWLYKDRHGTKGLFAELCKTLKLYIDKLLRLSTLCQNFPLLFRRLLVDLSHCFDCTKWLWWNSPTGKSTWFHSCHLILWSHQRAPLVKGPIHLGSSQELHMDPVQFYPFLGPTSNLWALRVLHMRPRWALNVHSCIFLIKPHWILNTTKQYKADTTGKVFFFNCAILL